MKWRKAFGAAALTALLQASLSCTPEEILEQQRAAPERLAPIIEFVNGPPINYYLITGEEYVYYGSPSDVLCVTKFAWRQAPKRDMPLVAYALDRNPFNCFQGDRGVALAGLPERIRELTPDRQYVAWSLVRHTLEPEDRKALTHREFAH